MTGMASIGLYRPKNDYNIGGVVRAAYAYQASMVAIEKRPTRRYGRIHSANTPNGHKHLPVIWADDVLTAIPHGSELVCVEIDDRAKCLTSFHHPDSAFYLFGPEEGSIPKEIIERCQRIVKVPTTTCLNLAATVNVVLYDRVAKALRAETRQGFRRLSSAYSGTNTAQPDHCHE